MKTFTIDIDADGIALCKFDVPGKTINTITSEVRKDLAELAERIKTDAAIKGAVITSGKTTGFCAGADLGEMGDILAHAGSGEAALKSAFDEVYSMNAALRALETCGKPVAAAINGLALGGGLEITLACHYRVVADDNRIQLGFPETKVGLFPGGGGTQRLPRLVGAQAALLAISEGKSMRPQEAKGAGVVHEVVPADQLLDRAKAWVKTGKAGNPWDDKSYKIPGGGPYNPAGFQVFVMGNALLRKQSYGNYPALTNMLSAVYEGLQVPIDAALRIESRYFLKTLMTPQARAMIRSLFLSKQDWTRAPRVRPPCRNPIRRRSRSWAPA